MARRPKHIAYVRHTTLAPGEEYDARNDDDEDEVDVEFFTGEVYFSMATAAALLALYTSTLYPSVPGGDSGELIVSAHEIGVAHPPGYPLFTMTAKLVMLVLPGGSAAWKINLLNAAYSAAAGGLLQLTVLRLTGCIGSSALAVGLFSLSRLTWTWSNSAEVFGLNNMFVALLMLLAVTFQLSESRRQTVRISEWGALCCGLSLCNQHTIIFYVAVIAVWVLLSLCKQQIMSFRIFRRLVWWFVVGLLPYLYLPVSAKLNAARWTWGDQTSLSGFLVHLLRKEYGTFDLAKDQEGAGFLNGINSYIEHAQNDMCFIAIPLAALGCFVALHRLVAKRDVVLLVFVSMGLLYGSFFAWRANLDTNNALLKGVVERFWLQSDMVLVVMAAVGCAVPIRWLVQLVQREGESPITVFITVIGAGSVVALQLRSYPLCSQSGNVVVHDFASSLLNSMPRNAVVFTKGDLPTNTMRYLHLCEKVRPDLHIVDVEILSYEWSLPMLRRFYPRLTFPGDFWHLTTQRWPDGRTSFNFKSLLDSNFKKSPMFACIGMQERDPSWQEGYHITPYGVCSRIERIGATFNPMLFANRTGGLADKWPYNSNTFEETSWEKVANDEMWHAKIASPFFLYSQAELATDQESKAHYLHASYELYFRAIKLHQTESRMEHKEHFPSFWHKNFALVCERLLQLDHDLDKVKLCKLSIYHFQLYLDQAPDDNDQEHIVEAMEILQQRLLTYKNLKAADEHMDRFLEKHGGAD